ncbi:hypothetical protein VTK56DRAFT_3349 [Thermocarpiscus australiensis]
MNQHSGSATLPRGFRYSGYDDAPKTPEPLLQTDEGQIPSPPRPRLKLRRRVVSQLCAPTQQFLASVAAADVPIPSIEEPETSSQDFAALGDYRVSPGLHCDGEADPNLLHPRVKAFSPPKTPAPTFEPSLPPTQYPDWTIDSAISSVESTPEPDYESSRPSTSRSTQTSASLFSIFSQVSDEDHCEIFGEEAKNNSLIREEDVGSRRPAGSNAKPRRAPWTKAMSDHLWSTYVLYLQDPKVTPFRMGRSCIPPHGVCLRVARAAKRSWRGSKALARAANSGGGRESGSATPTAGSSGTFIQWPHTCAATRAHLRELCRLKASSPGNNHRLLSRGTTPFSQAAARHWNRRSTPARSPAPFGTQDMSTSLVLSTSESMRPNGPLAQLATSSSEPAEPSRAPNSPKLAGQILETFEGEPSFAERRRLGSPFSASSYGPSSSGSLAAALGLSGSVPRRQSHTVGPRRTLQSPVRLSRSGTQKRRHTQSGVPRKRPSIGSDQWLDPSLRSIPATDTTSTIQAGSATLDINDELFVPRVQPAPTLTSSVSMPNVGAQVEAAGGLPSPPPPRLGSPFPGSNTSFSFPQRVHRMHQGGSVDLGALGRPFSTMQPLSREPTPPPSRHNLAGRLAYIDQRLKELRQRGDLRRRSESPL